MSAEYVDQGISGSTFDAIVRWKLDRMGRSLSHLITVLDEITALRRPRQPRRIH